MAKGAKKQQLQSQTTTQAAPPSYAQPYVNDILSRAQNASYQPYQAYGGNRIAGFTDAEKTAREGIMGLKAPTQFNTATEMATKAGNYTPGTFNTDSFTDAGMASKYMSPYMQNVVDVQKRKAKEDAQQTQLAGNLGASRQGTYGGSRQLLATMNRERDLATQMGDLQAKGSQDAYTAAMDQYRNEADRRMDAQKQIENSRQFGSNQALSAANQLSQLGSAQQSSDINRYAAMTGVGETERNLRQKALDMQYRDFTDQRDYEKNQLRDYSDIVGAQPEGNRTESVYGQPADQTGALIGAAGSIGSAYMANRAGNAPDYNFGKLASAAGGEIYSYNSGGLVALADGGGVSGDEGSVFKLRNDPKELLYSTMGDPAKLQALGRKGVDPTALGIAAMLAKRIHDAQSMAMAPQQTTVEGLFNPQLKPPQGQMQGQGQPQGLAGIAPQGQPMGDPMQGQPPMDPMQAQGLEALAQQDQPMEEQPMMAANGGLMNINLPDDYYDEDSYSHGGIAYFTPGGTVQEKENQRRQGIIDLTAQAKPVLMPTPEETSARKNQLLMDIHNRAMRNGKILKMDDLRKLSESELEAVAAGEKIPEIPSTLYGGNVEIDENSFAPTTNLGNRRKPPPATATPAASPEVPYEEDPIPDYGFSLPPQLMGNQPSDPYAGIEALINRNSTAQTEQAAPTKARSIQDYVDEQRGLMPKSPVEEEYKAQMLADQNKSNPNRDMWETAGKVFARMTEAANTPGATLIGSAATGLAGLSEDMAATRKGNEQRQKQNLIDRYNIEKAERKEQSDAIAAAYTRQGNDQAAALEKEKFKQGTIDRQNELQVQLAIAKAREAGETSRQNQTIAANWLNGRQEALEDARKARLNFIRDTVTDKTKQEFELKKLGVEYENALNVADFSARIAEKLGGRPDRYAKAVEVIMNTDTTYQAIKDPVKRYDYLEKLATRIANGGEGSQDTSSEESTQIGRFNVRTRGGTQ